MKEIVKYHNDMNTINLRNFNAVELNLLFAICAKIRDQESRVITYSFEQLRSLSHYSFTGNSRFVKDLETTYDKLIQLNFRIGNQANFTKFVLFVEYSISSETQQVSIAVNEKFGYVLNELTANFTRFELEEFVNLRSKYSKNLYRLLKQYKNTGHAYFTTEEFRSVLDIPKCYRMVNINKKILEPVIKELTPLFKNLKLEKIKNTSKRGHPVTHINFSFTPQWHSKSQQEESGDGFTFDEIDMLLEYGTQEQIIEAYKNYRQYQMHIGPIKNKLGFMIRAMQDFADMSDIPAKKNKGTKLSFEEKSDDQNDLESLFSSLNFFDSLED